MIGLWRKKGRIAHHAFRPVAACFALIAVPVWDGVCQAQPKTAMPDPLGQSIENPWNPQRCEEVACEDQLALEWGAHKPSVGEKLQSVRNARAGENAPQLIAEAYRHLSHREFRDAREKAQNALALQPENPIAHAIIANALLWLDGSEAGGDEIKQVEEPRLSHATGRELALARIYHGTQKWLRALDACNQATEAAKASQRRENAGQKKQLKLQARDAEMSGCNLFSEAAAEFQKAISGPADSGDRYGNLQALVAHNNLGAVFHMLGELAMRQNRGQEALKHYMDAEQEYKASLELDDYQVAHFNQGNNYLAMGRAYRSLPRHPDRPYWKLAESELRRSIALYSENPGSHALLAAALVEQGKPHLQEAASHLRIALEQGLNDPLVNDLLLQLRKEHILD